MRKAGAITIRAVVRISVLHLTDVHLGMRGTRELWPQAKATFFQDLQYILEESDLPISLIAFTGDFTQRGSAEEFQLVDEFIYELMEWFETAGQTPVLVTVPGNHDLARPDVDSAEVLALRTSWSNLKDQFYDEPANSYRAAIARSLDAYTKWQEGVSGYRPTDFLQGILPGDFTARLTVGDVTLGLLGLNTTFKQLSDSDEAGSLAVSARQIQAAARGDLPRWAARNDLNILLTHQPLSWLDRSSRDDVNNLVLNEPNNFQLHLCGHLHANELRGHRPGSPTGYFSLQGTSLFGLDSWGSPSESRAFGYSILTLDVTRDKRSVVVWPREAFAQDGAWRLDAARSAGVPLPKGSPVSTEIVFTPRQQAAAQQPRPAAPLSPGPHFATQLEAARFVLVAGEGAAGTSLTDTGETVASHQEVRELLAGAAGIPYDEAADLDGLYRLAASRAKRQVDDSLYAALHARSVGATARGLATMPFKEVYDLTPSDALRTAFAAGPLRRAFDLREVTSAYPVSRDPSRRLFLNVQGTPSEPSFEGLTQGDRTSARSQWFSRFTDSLVSFPILIATDDVDAWDLWHLITLRGPKPPGGEIRPRSYLACPMLSTYQQHRLSEYNITWLQCRVADLAEMMESEYRPAAKSGRAAVDAELRSGPSSDPQPTIVAHAREEAEAGTRRFLLGYEPTWGDVLGRFVVTRSAEVELLALSEQGDGRAIVVLGTAGSGRSTLLKRIAVALDTKGERVVWIDRSFQGSISNLRRSVTVTNPAAIVIDDIDIFGNEAAAIIENFSRQGMKVIVGCRSARMSVLHNLVDREDFWLDRLSDRDVLGFMRLMREANLLGKRIQSADADLRTLFERADKQLLVAMIELTSGQRFSEKIGAELRALDAEAQLVYGGIAISHHVREQLPRDVIRVGLGMEGAMLHRVLQHLVAERLVIARGSELYTIRHGRIADELVANLKTMGLLPEIVADLMRAAGTAHALDRAEHPGESLYDRVTTRLMIRLLSHSQLMAFGLTIVEARRIYDAAAGVLRGDFHYHLQRGSYELEAPGGDIELAEIELETAKALEPSDYAVVTEWAYMRMRIAYGRPEETERAIDAIEQLVEVIRRHGGRSPHTFVVLSREGRRWLKGGTPDPASVERFALMINDRLRLGVSLHPYNTVIASEARNHQEWLETRARPEGLADEA